MVGNRSPGIHEREWRWTGDMVILEQKETQVSKGKNTRRHKHEGFSERPECAATTKAEQQSAQGRTNERQVFLIS